MPAMGRSALLVTMAVLAASCVSPATTPRPEADAGSPVPWPTPPPIGNDALPPDVASAADRLADADLAAPPDASALDVIAGSDDARLAWLLADLLRLAVTPDSEDAIVDAFTRLTGADPRDRRFGANPWLAVTNLLIGWDLPAPPRYREQKAAMLLRLEPAWEPFLVDTESTIDWRVTTWGGVFMDRRPAGSDDPCERACIPALDDPALVPASEGDWYADDRIVFGLRVGGAAVALPRHIMEVHELVNLTIGGRRVGVPYCTLCGAAQAYYIDSVSPGTEPLVLRTSGLLSRSNKLMYDLGSGSAFHTFTGRAASGPLRELGVVLEPVSVTVSTWGAWKAAHPDTRIVARDAGIGRAYPDDPLCGRDAAGPIFPIGPADSRLPAQSAVVGVVDDAGAPVAFAADAARAELAAGRAVSHAGVRLVPDGDGMRATSAAGDGLVSHEAFWFAWSHFHPTTALWAPLPTGAAPPVTEAGPAAAVGGCQDLLDVLDP
jgi:hypothetical protein